MMAACAIAAFVPSAAAASGSVTADGITGQCTATGTGDLNTHWHFECTNGSRTMSDDHTGPVYAKELNAASGCVTATLWADGNVVDTSTSNC